MPMWQAPPFADRPRSRRRPSLLRLPSCGKGMNSHAFPQQVGALPRRRPRQTVAQSCHRKSGGAKNASVEGTNNRGICFTGVRFFRNSLEFYALLSCGRIDVMGESRKKGAQSMIAMAVEGRVLVASTTERDVKGGDRKDVGASTPGSGVKSSAARKKRASAPKDDGQIGNALRTAYQRTMEEEIPTEMLDLLNKLG